MTRGIGTDIIEINRVGGIIEKYRDRFLDRIFTKREQEYCLRHSKYPQHFAGRFAAKEAIAKALGHGIGSEIGWLDIEILNDPQGKPAVMLSPDLRSRLGEPKILLSISHSKEYATAVALVE